MLIGSGARNGAVPSEHTMASACDLQVTSGDRTLHTRPASALILRRALGHQRAERVCGPDSDTGERAQHAIHATCDTPNHAVHSLLVPAALAIRPLAHLPHPCLEVRPALVQRRQLDLAVDELGEHLLGELREAL